MEERHRVPQAAVVNALDDDAAEDRDTDASGEDHRRTGAIIEPKLAERSLQLHHGAEWGVLQHAFEGRVAESGSDLDHVFAGRARDRKPAGVAFGIDLWRVAQRDVDELTGAVIPVGGLGKAERHRALGHHLAADQR